MLFSWVGVDNEQDGAIVYQYVHNQPIWPQLKHNLQVMFEIEVCNFVIGM